MRRAMRHIAERSISFVTREPPMAGTLIDFVMRDKEFMTELNKARKETVIERHRGTTGSISERPAQPSLVRRLGTFLRSPR